MNETRQDAPGGVIRTGWRLRMVDPDIVRQANAALAIGNCWLAPWLHRCADLSPEYRRRWAGLRPPIVVVTPGLDHWCMDRVQYSNGVPQPNGWLIDGSWDEAYPALTASPSVLMRFYHGWLKDGWLSLDLDGREYYEPGCKHG